MEIQKLTTTKGSYISCNLLNSAEGIDGYINTGKIKELHSSLAENIFSSNIYYHEKSESFVLQTDNTPNPLLFIVEDMFADVQIWIREGSFAKDILQQLKEHSCLDNNKKKELILDSISSYYDNTNTEQKILADFSPKKEHLCKLKVKEAFIETAYLSNYLFNNQTHTISIENQELEKINSIVKKKITDSLKMQELLERKMEDKVSKNKRKTKLVQ